jgi:predicted TIM-barrel fold metal-dependent hydrolase
MAIIDSQVHAYAANTPQRPWRKPPHDWPDHVTGEEMVGAMDAVGVDGAIMVSPNSLYGYDASYTVDMQRAYPGRFAIVKPVNPNDPAVDEIISEWKKTPGAVAVRVMFALQSAEDLNSAGIDRILRAAARHDLKVNLQCGNNLDTGTALIDKHPQTRFVIDHLGFYQPRTKPAPANVWADLPKVLELARRPNAAIKVSAVGTMSREPFPYHDIWDPLARVFDAWGFERCLWGSDWTRTFSLVNYEQAVESFRVTDRLNDRERAMLMGGACAKVYGWSPQKE